jgi:hypothetical protein
MITELQPWSPSLTLSPLDLRHFLTLVWFDLNKLSQFCQLLTVRTVRLCYVSQSGPIVITKENCVNTVVNISTIYSVAANINVTTKTLTWLPYGFIMHKKQMLLLYSIKYSYERGYGLELNTVFEKNFLNIFFPK